MFLYDAATCSHLAARGGDTSAFKRAIELYEAYLSADPAATDRKRVTDIIRVLRDPAARKTERGRFGDLAFRGLAVIETEPPGAEIYLDNDRSKPFAKTPWSGTLTGKHTLSVERTGFHAIHVQADFSPDRLHVMGGVMRRPK